jgi:V/A-type H+-transporting ATPase subunit D
MSMKQELQFAELGYELLDQKRNILVIELLGLVDQADDAQQQADEALAEAHRALRRAVLSMGKLKTARLAGAVNIEADVELSQRRVMGVRLPVVETSFADHAPYYSTYRTTFRVDETVARFREALELMGRLAELKVSIMRLAREVKKTIRKVNALEKIAIPELTETVKIIQERLEENERDMFVLMKMVKSRLEAKEQEQWQGQSNGSSSS